MNKLWILSGRIAFWVCWPLLWVYLRFGRSRTRVIVIADGKIILVKGWLSDGKWSLPGGGLHRQEPAIDGAKRELQEETGITIQNNQLQQVNEGWVSSAGLRYRHVAFLAQIAKPHKLKKQWLEVTEVEWIELSMVCEKPEVSQETKQILRASNTVD
ncbi:MAG: NUDIX hydrolase [Candidatus Saccharibacteria bacterium]|nr:NUDIX hydrolase [Candidatus Saccharibacteria bacterium]